MSVLIEFTRSTDKRARGERVYVDDDSAKSLVEKKKVAKRVTDADKPAVVEPEPESEPGPPAG